MLRILSPLMGALLSCSAAATTIADDWNINAESYVNIAQRIPINAVSEEVAVSSKSARGPIIEAVSAAEDPLPRRVPDTMEEASGRRILSTAFVRVGPDRLLTVELRTGRTIKLRDVVLGPHKYCGSRLHGEHAALHYCGSYAEIVAARPGN